MTEQVLPEEVRGSLDGARDRQIEVWEEAAAGAEWEVTVRAQAWEESVSAQNAELKHLISREFHVIP